MSLLREFPYKGTGITSLNETIKVTKKQKKHKWSIKIITHYQNTHVKMWSVFLSHTALKQLIVKPSQRIDCCLIMISNAMATLLMFPIQHSKLLVDVSTTNLSQSF